jgi:hypothetical protein
VCAQQSQVAGMCLLSIAGITSHMLMCASKTFELHLA